MEDRHARLERADQAVVPNEEVLAVAANAGRTSDRELLQSGQRIICALYIDACTEFHAAPTQPPGPLELPEPCEELPIRSRGTMRRGTERVQTPADRRPRREHLLRTAPRPLVAQAQDR